MAVVLQWATPENNFVDKIHKPRQKEINLKHQKHQKHQKDHLPNSTMGKGSASVLEPSLEPPFLDLWGDKGSPMKFVNVALLFLPSEWGGSGRTMVKDAKLRLPSRLPLFICVLSVLLITTFIEIGAAVGPCCFGTFNKYLGASE